MLRNVSRWAAATLAAALAALLLTIGGTAASASVTAKAPAGADAGSSPTRIDVHTKGTLHKVDVGARTQSDQHALGPDLGTVPPRADVRGLILVTDAISADHDPAQGRAPPPRQTRAPPR
ncbi:hypothetical protein FE697_007000 [Mumia zhuanghuii]|uniref:Uncharacterized protein n=2 Tax=Mumia TaxID=1546255 RepID=A0ABW1QM21_9ACTN|nr:MULTISPECIES: hypothetical protein [Mumia]KAA1423355.1 hypothetical protein FE697_007000 [Mumia zhuanghuii]